MSNEIEAGKVPSPYSEAEQHQMRKELQKQYNKFKKRWKLNSKSELIAILWEQVFEFKKLQDIAQQLFEENKALKERLNETTNKQTTDNNTESSEATSV